MLGKRTESLGLEPVARQLEDYLQATLHVDASLTRWDQTRSLPAFVARAYRFYESRVAAQNCLFMVQRERAATTPATIARDTKAVAEHFDGLVIFAAPSIGPTLRARLVERGTPFAVPGNQLYIPHLAIDLREHFRTERSRSTRLTPAAQALLFHHLLGRGEGCPTPSSLVDELSYSAMSLGRAFDELVATDLAKVERHGREKRLIFMADRRALLEASNPLLRTPVRGVHAVRFANTRPAMSLAGESALAELTDLAPPRMPVYAIPAADWMAFFSAHAIQDFHYEYEGEALIETWRYDPTILGAGRTVDPLSLYAQYWDHGDERLAQAAQQLIENHPW